MGRPIDTFAHKMDHPDPEWVDDSRRVLASGKPVERELRDARGKAFFLRVLRFRVKGTVEGVVSTLIDVSGLEAVRSPAASPATRTRPSAR